jgi:hypothetical protein
MDLSETIIAAMIGAGATVATATFQLFMAFRSRKADSKPKRSSGVRSTLAVFGLVLGAAVAGFAYSELRAERERENTMAMEQRISDRLQALALANGQLTQLRNGNGADNGADEATLLAAAGGSRPPARSEATAHIAACRSQTPAYGDDPAGCDAANANHVALCASVPSQASVLEVQLFARAAGASPDWGASPGWDQSRVSVDQDIGGARFVDSTYEVKQGADRKAVCANFLQWNSERGHVARVVVAYTMGTAIAVRAEPAPADSGDSSLPARAADTEAGGTAGGDPVTPELVSPDPALGAVQAAIAAQP